MKIHFIITMVLTGLSVSAQRSNQGPKMQPTFSTGYYINNKGDTIKGEIQNNPESQLDFYSQFSFKTGKQKPRVFNEQKAKGFGFDGKDFVLAIVDGERIYLERLAIGRLRLYEYQFEGKIDGNRGIASDLFIRDTQPENNNSALSQYKKIPKKFYKKALKPYLKDQPMIWSDLDKYNFNKQNVLVAIEEFNKFYAKK